MRRNLTVLYYLLFLIIKRFLFCRQPSVGGGAVLPGDASPGGVSPGGCLLVINNMSSSYDTKKWISPITLLLLARLL